MDEPISSRRAAAPNGPFALRAKWVFPVVGEPVEDGWITVVNGVIRQVGRGAPDVPDVDLGQVALLPGLVNCHVHLEFSDLGRPLGQSGMPFPAWIGHVVRHRRRQLESAEHQVNVPRASWKQGLDECLATGTVALGEIATLPWEWQSFHPREAPPHITVFLEWLGLSAERIPALQAAASEHLNSSARWNGADAGLSPHAPYTVHPELLDKAIELAIGRNVPLAMHLAESADELELLATGRGPFAELLESLGVWHPELFPGNRRPFDYLRALGRARQVLVIHGNYLESDEMAWIARQAGRMTVVFCPRTHAYFGHPRYPLRRLLDLGVPVALGTDSRASNPDLSLLEEMRYVAGHYPELSGAEILRLGTTRGADALGQASRLGQLAPGRTANFTLVALGEKSVADPYQALWEGGPARGWNTAGSEKK